MAYGPMDTVLCADCGLLFRDPLASDTEIERYYQSDYYEKYQGGVDTSAEQLARVLDRNCRWLTYLRSRIDFQGKRVLDAGCGRAVLLKLLAETGEPAELLGLEPSAAIVDWCRQQNYPFEVVQGTVGSFVDEDPARSGAIFDVILFSGVLEHLSNPLRELRALRQLLAPTGLLYIYTHSEEPGADWNPVERISLVHVLYLTEATIRRLLGQAGFGVVRLEKRGTSMHVLVRPDNPVTTWPMLAPDNFVRLFRRYRHAASPFGRWQRTLKRWLSYPLALGRRLAKELLRNAWPTLYSPIITNRLP
jgi:SAM-dependent methyltransferase